MKKLGVYTDLRKLPVLETEDLEEAIGRAVEENSANPSDRIWVLDTHLDVYAYVQDGKVKRF